MDPAPIPAGGLVAVIEADGVVRDSSAEWLPSGSQVIDRWPALDLGRHDAVQRLGDVTAVVRAFDGALVVDVDTVIDDELAVRRWLDEQRSAVRDAETLTDAADVVASSVGRFLGLDAVEVRSFDGPDRRWVRSDDLTVPSPRSDVDRAARRWSEELHVVPDLSAAPGMDDPEAACSAIARPPSSLVGPGLGALVSVPIRYRGGHRGEVTGSAAEAIPAPGAATRQALATLVADLAARGAHDARVDDDPHDVLEAIGHDLRSPLRAVANYAELLAVPDDPADDDLRAFTGRMHLAARQANEQLDGLVEFIDAGLVGEPEPVDLDRVLAQIEASWTTSLAAVTIERDGRLLRPVAGPGLAQALSIIVENSVAVRRQATPITIHVRTEAMVAGGCRIVVVDAGPGVLREISAFRWTDGTRSQVTVGPALARRLIELHGGRVTLDAEAGVATTWTIELPSA
ncbi:MAG: HAMP domain-containing sensor histidine kinase [Actinomycetota bacterium]